MQESVRIMSRDACLLDEGLSVISYKETQTQSKGLIIPIHEQTYTYARKIWTYLFFSLSACM